MLIAREAEIKYPTQSPVEISKQSTSSPGRELASYAEANIQYGRDKGDHPQNERLSDQYWNSWDSGGLN
jgi:hypothetical protein